MAIKDPFKGSIVNKIKYQTILRSINRPETKTKFNKLIKIKQISHMYICMSKKGFVTHENGQNCRRHNSCIALPSQI